MESRDVGVYNVPTAKMIYQEVKKSRPLNYQKKQGPKPSVTFDAPRLHIAYSTSAITPRSGSTAGTGKATLKYIPGESGTATAIEDFADGAEVDVYNIKPQPIDEDKLIYIAREFGSGKWVVLDEECPRIRATLTSGNSFQDDTASDPHTAGSIVGINKEYSGDSTVDVYNPLGIKLWSGATIHAEYNVTEERWEVYAATSDKVVHGIQRNDGDCEFQKLDGANGWNAWDDGEDVPWVSEIRVECNSIKYDTLCTTNISAGDIDAITKIEFNDDTCELYYYKKSSDQYGYCFETIAGTAGNFDFVTAVYASTGGLYYNKKCSGEYLIIELESCESTPPCGTCSWTSDDNLNWVQTDSCSGTCECVEPAFPPRVVGQIWTTNCEEP
jgi:hypothetical protein